MIKSVCTVQDGAFCKLCRRSIDASCVLVLADAGQEKFRALAITSSIAVFWGTLLVVVLKEPVWLGLAYSFLLQQYLGFVEICFVKLSGTGAESYESRLMSLFTVVHGNNDNASVSDGQVYASYSSRTDSAVKRSVFETSQIIPVIRNSFSFVFS